MPTSVSLKSFSAALSRLIRLMPAPSTVTKTPALGLVEVKPDEHGATVSYRRGSFCLDCSVEGVEAAADFMVDGRDLLKACRTVEELPVLEPVDGVLVLGAAQLPTTTCPTTPAPTYLREVVWGQTQGLDSALVAGITCAGGPNEFMDFAQVEFTKYGRTSQVASTNRYIASASNVWLPEATGADGSFALSTDAAKVAYKALKGLSPSVTVFYGADAATPAMVRFATEGVSLQVEPYLSSRPLPPIGKLFERRGWLNEVICSLTELSDAVTQISKECGREAANETVVLTATEERLRVSWRELASEIEVETVGIGAKEVFELAFDVASLSKLLKGLGGSSGTKVTIDFEIQYKRTGRPQNVGFENWPVKLLIRERDQRGA